MYGYDSVQDLIAGLTKIENQLYVDPTRRGEFVRIMQEQGAVRSFESEIYRKDGSTIWISENARAVRDEFGAIIYYEGMVEDITERQRLETELHASEQSLSALINNIDDSIWSVDTGYRLITFNAVFAQTFEEQYHTKIRVGDVILDHLPAEWRAEDVALYDPRAGRREVRRRAPLPVRRGGGLLRDLLQPDPHQRRDQRRGRLQQGHHRAPARPHRAAGRHGAGRVEQPAQERVPGQHEPRNPHADERRHRHDRPAADDRPDPRAAGVRAHRAHQRRVAPRRHQRHSRLLQDRGGQARPRDHRLRPARGHRQHHGPARRPGAQQGSGAGRLHPARRCRWSCAAIPAACARWSTTSSATRSSSPPRARSSSPSRA
ncbi:MAG: PAS domain S-box protein [Verrucomicrobiota bacterium]